jgi:hypothetical protein
VTRLLRRCIDYDDGVQCTAVGPWTRCPVHTRARASRLYGPDHRAERIAWTPAVEAGHVTCWRCNLPIAADQPWDLGHRTGAPSHPEHVACNRGAPHRRLTDTTTTHHHHHDDDRHHRGESTGGPGHRREQDTNTEDPSKLLASCTKLRFG